MGTGTWLLWRWLDMSDAQLEQEARELANILKDVVERESDATFPGWLRHCGDRGAGDFEIGLLDLNIVWWAGLSEAAARAVEIAREEKMVGLDVVEPMVYLIDGGMLNIPLVKRPPPQGYKKPHWIPVIFIPYRKLLERARKNPKRYPENVVAEARKGAHRG